MRRWLAIIATGLLVLCVAASAFAWTHGTLGVQLDGPQPKNAGSYYSSGAYAVYTNTPDYTGIGLPPGPGVNANIYYNPAQFPNNTTISQVWPAYPYQPNGSGEWGYPCIIYTLPGGPIAFNSISSLVLNYNITISGSNATNGGTTPQYFDVAIDMFTGTGFEIFINLYDPASHGASSNVAWNLDSVSPLGPGTKCFKTGSGIFCDNAVDSLNALNGPINLASVFSILIAQGVISGADTLTTVDLGTENFYGTFSNVHIATFSASLTHS